MRIAICDNILSEREKYKEIFRTLAMKNGIAADFDFYESGAEMLFHLENPKKFADIVFLDVYIPDMTGIEAAQKLREVRYAGEIIFLTSSQEKQHILSGYDVNALHYIIKNETTYEKIIEIFLRAEKAVSHKNQKTLTLSAGNEWRNILIKNIQYFEIFKKIITVHYENKSFAFYTRSLEYVEKQLAGLDFVRIHRSYLVALCEIESLSYNSVVMRNGTKLPVGRTYYLAVKKALSDSKQIHAII